jgi:hypothetical protein
VLEVTFASLLSALLLHACLVFSEFVCLMHFDITSRSIPHIALVQGAAKGGSWNLFEPRLYGRWDVLEKRYNYISASNVYK